MARKNTVPILLAATVAGGLTLGGTAAAAAAVAQTYTAAPNVAMQPYPPRPFNPYAFVFLGPDPFAELAGLAREGVLVGGPQGAGGAGGAGAGGAGAAVPAVPVAPVRTVAVRTAGAAAVRTARTVRTA